MPLVIRTDPAFSLSRRGSEEEERAAGEERGAEEARDGAISDLSMFAKSIEKSAPIVARPPAPAIAGPTTGVQLVAGPAGGSAAQTCATGWGGVSSFMVFAIAVVKRRG